MDCLPQDSGEKDGRVSGWAELLQGNPSMVKQPAAETGEGRESSPRQQGRALDRRLQQVPALVGAHQLPVPHGAAKTPVVPLQRHGFPSV